MSESSGSHSSADEVKRKFREALERKNEHHAQSAAHLDGHSKATAPRQRQPQTRVPPQERIGNQPRGGGGGPPARGGGAWW
ncbi:DUF5302 domain-containing protein [Nocardia cyriacigeorgica]|uniref:DUF5302 domain-containing protein n=1 Tax=Nocardia cyriacigeorgica TaxID=135487 RepID=UPI003CC7F645